MSQRHIAEAMNTTLAIVEPAETVAAMARLTHDRDTSKVLVADGEGTAGVVTDRDLAIRALSPNGEPETHTAEKS